MSYSNNYGDRVVSMSDLNKPNEGILKSAYRKAKSSIGRGLRRKFGKKTLEEKYKSQGKQARKEGMRIPRWNSTQGGGKRKRRKTQRKPRKTRRTKRRTRRSRR
tara:strand:- start:3295 stop:3606 length:312 start_codon:yes stop_codon:yes gene_type:complete